MSETALAPENTLLGVHHVTAITSDGQKIFDFFAKILGMHLIKKTVNQDDVETYHLYTPQGVRGLKLPTENTEGTMPMSHSARSAWIETGCPGCRRRYHLVALRKECVD